MDNTVLISIISTVGVVVAAGLGAGAKLMEMWWQEYKMQKKKANRPKLVDVAKYSMEIDKILYDFTNKMGATRAMVARFHNGGQFINNIQMDKFSVTNEISTCEHEHSISQRMQNILLSNYSSVMYELLFNNKYFKPDTKECDPDFRREMELDKIKSIYFFLIKDIDETPIGYISLSFHKTKKELSNDDISYIWSKHNPILNFLHYKNEEVNNKS